MKFTPYDPSYTDYSAWRSLCPEGSWKEIPSQALSGLIPESLLAKSPSVLLMASGVPQVSVFVANINRYDIKDSAFDQQPYIAAFDHNASAASGGFVDHGHWVGRTTRPDPLFFAAITASGIQAHYPPAQMPSGTSGKLEDLAVDSQAAAFWVAYSALSNKPQ